MSRRLFLWAALGAVVTLAYGQTNDGIPAPKKAPTQPRDALNIQPQPPSLKELRTRIKELQKISEDKPDTKEARDALVEEVQVLVQHASIRDSALEQRRHELVTKLKKDEAISRKTRAQLSSLSANMDVGADRSLDPDQRLAAYADIAWKQIEEFPENLEQYSALSRIARDSSDAQAEKIARRLLVSQAPSEIKAGAQVILAQTGLVGKSLQDLLGADAQQLREDSALTLFTWSLQQPSALSLAKALKQAFPDDAIVAICLDSNVAAAKGVAAQAETNTRLIFSEEGTNSFLCKQLLLDKPAVYRVNRQGIITTVSGLNQLSVAHYQQKAKETKR